MSFIFHQNYSPGDKRNGREGKHSRKRRPWWTRGTQMDKYSEKYRLYVSNNSIRLCRSFQKVKKAFFIIFWRLFYVFQCLFGHWLRRCMEISMFLFPCYLRNSTWKFPCYLPVICVKINRNFYVPLLVIWRVKVHGNFHVPLSMLSA